MGCLPCKVKALIEAATKVGRLDWVLKDDGTWQTPFGEYWITVSPAPYVVVAKSGYLVYAVRGPDALRVWKTVNGQHKLGRPRQIEIAALVDALDNLITAKEGANDEH